MRKKIFDKQINKTPPMVNVRNAFFLRSSHLQESETTQNKYANNGKKVYEFERVNKFEYLASYSQNNYNSKTPRQQ